MFLCRSDIWKKRILPPEKMLKHIKINGICPHTFKEREEQIDAEKWVFEWPDNMSINKDYCT